jgi:hypothetical protein
MKTPRIVLLSALLLLGSVAGVAHAQISADLHIGPSGQASVDVGYFYDNLASYGNWIERPSYGWVWTPRSVAASWQPYQSGHWAWSDQGWTWVTSEPYGWATYHYGRWYDDPEIGWSWVPGNEWAPSWVSFQEGSDYIGWAPLPPSVNISAGFNGLVDVSIAPASYVFVQERYFLAPQLNSYFVPRDRVGNIYRETRNTTNYRYAGDRVYCNGVAVDQIQRVVGHPVPRYQLADSRTRGAARIQGNQIQVFRPQVQRAANVQPPSARPVARKAVVNAAQFQQSHPDRAAARRAVAQGTAQPAATAAQVKPARPARTPQAQRAERNGQAAGQVQPEATPPAHTRRTPQPAPAQTEQQRPAAQPKHQRQPATQQQAPPPARERQQRVQPQQERQQRPPQDNPPPQRQARQQPPPRQQQEHQQPPPQQQERQQQRQQQRQQKEKPQQDDHKPPQR